MRLIGLLLLACATGLAQSEKTNILVRFAPDNTPYAGLTNYPAQIENVDFFNVPAGWSSNFTEAAFAEHMEGLRAAHSIANSNAAYLLMLKVDTNKARLLELHALIPTGRTMAAGVETALASIEASLASGTNTQAQVVTRIRQLIAEVEKVRAIEANILEYLQRLGPVLRDLYKPEQDETQ